MAFGEDEDDKGMTFDKLKAYMANPDVAAQAMRSAIQGAPQQADSYARGMNADVENKLADASQRSRPTQEELDKQYDKNQEYMNMATMSGGLNVKPANIGKIAGNVLEATNPSKHTENIDALSKFIQAARSKGDAGLAKQIQDVSNAANASQAAGKIHTVIPPDMFAKIKQMLGQ